MAVPKAPAGTPIPNYHSIGNWSEWLYRTGVREYNSEVEQYARSHGLSYEDAAYQLYYGVGIGQMGPSVAETGSSTVGSVGSVGNAGGTTGYPRWEFDFEAQQKKAFESLKPYYEKILEFAQGDLDLAKKILSFDYSQGLREAKQDYELKAREYAVAFPQETRSLEARWRELGVLEPEEKELLWTTLNRRGVAQAAGGLPTEGLAAKEARRLGEKQAIRREMLTRLPELQESQAIRQEVIERVLENRQARLEQEKGVGTERAERGFAREKQTLGREHEREARGMATDVMGIQQAKYGATVGEWLAEEARRARAEERKWQEQLQARSAGGGGGGGVGGGGGGSYTPPLTEESLGMLTSAMLSKGYNDPAAARAVAKGDFGRFWREYMG